MTDAIRAVEPDNPLIGPEKTILDYDTVALDDEKHALVIIDQTKLPSRIEILSLTAQKDIWDAIYLLKVRGAPAIGVAAAIGIYLAAREIAISMTAQSGDAAGQGKTTPDYNEFLRRFREASAYLNSSRPTAVNLSWALRRMENVVLDHKKDSVPQIIDALHDEALAIREEDILVCRSIGKYGLSLVKPGDGLLTHCNAGQLATVKYGTATAPMYLGQEKGYNFKVYCDETRPLLQGARLTSFELSSAGLDVTLLCDNMSASLMREGKIQAVFVGCDRVAANGDTANKIGTSMAALAAKRYNVPFYVCAPTSTIDMDTATGDDIVIEQRKPEEVTDMWYEKPMAAPGVKVYNPAFDVTDHDLITGIVTEFGIAYPPYNESFQEIFLKKQIRDTVQRMMKDMDIK
ncbi:MAG TPA: S-methyl-5-thioribose-1-phosphate isomerase [Candidatus Anaerobutyricum stercoripullorum]|uniref:Methylthioribose-1-phosphate isomerase n=1 Tax=Candidatus Anaerobutyricum stercoripullorum TaxID=2838456 RepID=A0A9D1X3X3_9FIRM|nr:S-methyl-5-thioribose-1-phosphate isomerase [Candidatus Anaerobutyricum stercoripullorum]